MPSSNKNANAVSNDAGFSKEKPTNSLKNEQEIRKIHQFDENLPQMQRKDPEKQTSSIKDQYMSKESGAFEQRNIEKFENFSEKDAKNEGNNGEIVAKMQTEIDNLRRKVRYYEKEMGKIAQVIELNEDLLRQNQEYKKKLAILP